MELQVKYKQAPINSFSNGRPKHWSGNYLIGDLVSFIILFWISVTKSLFYKETSPICLQIHI